MIIYTATFPRHLVIFMLSLLTAGCASATVNLQDPDAIQLGCEQVAAGAVRATFGPPPPPPQPSTTTKAAGAVAGVASVAATVVGVALPPVGALISIGASTATTVGAGATYIAGLPKDTPLPDPQLTLYQTTLATCLQEHGVAPSLSH